MAIPKEIADLVQAFEFHRPAYLRGQDRYNEAQLRVQFIDPFFRALDWDIGNTKQSALRYLEVVVNDPITVHGKTLYLDYSFRYGEEKKFIVETKKPSVRIKDDAAAALQLRRYAWNEKLPLSILTNFDEFSVYDCTIKPLPGDSASVARVAYFSYTEYPEQWDWIEKIFARESIRKGLFENYAKSTKGKRGTTSVDEDILGEIEKWREILAKNIALRNTLSVNELNTVVQRTIDRILFLRICEDRKIEEYGALLDLTSNEQIYSHLCDLFRKADEKYNSGLFHFQKEPGWDELPDELSLSIKIDDKILKDIIKNLYFPNSQYLFNVIPPAILGQVYEQFLGKVIRLTEGGQAKIEFKPEVKKAGGVFYTPEFIVKYIIQETVGELVKNKTPREAAKLKILDPACGSGSFLLGAYKYLLDWHIDWYLTNLVPVYKEKGSETDPAVKALFPEPLPRKKAKGSLIEDSFPIYKSGDLGEQAQNTGGWKLKTSEKKRILLNNIFGVDIDPQAVEVTKLSLLLKVLADESSETISKQLKISDERALPSLDQNIKCGNSLIGWDILTPEMPADEVKRINPFDWSKEFESVMAAGGFDAVIGNPPYIRIQTMKEWAPTEVEFYKTKFVSASKGNYDIYVVFVEKGLSLLNKNGLLGYILPHKFFNAQYGQPLRSVIAKGKHLKEIVHFGHQQVFENATTYTCLLFLGKKGYDEFCFKKIDDLISWRSSNIAVKGIINSKKATNNDWNFVVGNDSQLFDRLDNITIKLGNISEIFVGLQTDADDVFILEERIKQDNKVLCYSKATDQEHWFEDYHLKPFLKGSLNIRRYYLDNVSKRLIFPYELDDGKSVLISSENYKLKYPLTWDYLEKNHKRLSERYKEQIGKLWYGYVYKKNHTKFGLPKLLVPSLANSACFASDLDGKYFFVGSGGGGGGGYAITLKPEEKMSSLYLLGLLNSAVSTFYLKKISSTFRGGYFALNRQYIEQLPIRTINFTDPTDIARHDRMVTLVTQMLDLNKKLPDARLEQERTMLSRQIEATDGAIDKLVYDLYGLTEEEIAVVEGNH